MNIEIEPFETHKDTEEYRVKRKKYDCFETVLPESRCKRSRVTIPKIKKNPEIP